MGDKVPVFMPARRTGNTAKLAHPFEGRYRVGGSVPGWGICSLCGEAKSQVNLCGPSLFGMMSFKDKISEGGTQAG